MSYLGKHAEFYDLFYKDKPYYDEALYVADLIQRRCPDARSVLDLGCGTGLRCLEMARHGYKVTGLDQSPAMLAVARQNLLMANDIPNGTVDFLLGDITEYLSPHSYDAAISLFHVFSYLTTEESLREAVVRSFKNLRPGGVLIFDYWHGPGVLHDLPSPRTRSAEDSHVTLVRKSVPRHFPDAHLVELTLSLETIDKQTGIHERVDETYLLRYWFPEELERQLERAGFQEVRHYSWLTHSVPIRETWQACTVAVVPVS